MGKPSQINKDLDTNIVVTRSIAPAANRTATTNGDNSLDCLTHVRTAVVFNFGTITDGGWTPSVEESDSGTGSWTAATVTGDVTERISTNDETCVVLGVARTKRYVRAVVTESTASTTGALFSAEVVGITTPTGV